MKSTEQAAGLAAGERNRRTTPRHGVDEDARLLLVDRGSTVSCRIVDLSLGGCCLRSRERFAAASMVRVEVSFKVRGLAFRFSGVIQWSDGRQMAGIRFVNVSARRGEELVEALCEVEAENAAKAARLAAEQQAAEQQASALKAVALAAAPPTAQDALPRTPVPIPESKPLRPELFRPQALRTEPQKPEVQIATAPQAKPAGRERREALREAVDTTAVIHLIHVGSRLTGRILDLSLSGCRIRTDERFPVGIYTRAETEFHLEGMPFRLGGVVQAIHDRQTVGIRFLDMSSRKREQVDRLIAEIREMKEKGKRE